MTTTVAIQYGLTKRKSRMSVFTSAPPWVLPAQSQAPVTRRKLPNPMGIRDATPASSVCVDCSAWCSRPLVGSGGHRACAGRALVERVAQEPERLFYLIEDGRVEEA